MLYKKDQPNRPGPELLDIHALTEGIRSGRLVPLQRVRPDAGPLAPIFRQPGTNGRAQFEINGRIFPDVRYDRYVGSRPPEILRIFFRNLQKQGGQVILQVRSDEVAVLKKVDLSAQNLPSCDYGPSSIPEHRGEQLLVESSELEHVAKRGQAVVKAQEVRLIGTGSEQECPLYHRPVCPTPEIATVSRRGVVTDTIQPEGLPDMPLHDVHAFTQHGVLQIMKELDPSLIQPSAEIRAREVVPINPQAQVIRGLSRLIVGNLDLYTR